MENIEHKIENKNVDIDSIREMVSKNKEAIERMMTQSNEEWYSAVLNRIQAIMSFLELSIMDGGIDGDLGGVMKEKLKNISDRVLGMKGDSLEENREGILSEIASIFEDGDNEIDPLKKVA